MKAIRIRAFTHSLIAAAACAIAVAMPAAAAPIATIMIDDFSSPTLDPNWIQVVALDGQNNPNEDYTVSTTLNPGRLSVTISGSNITNLESFALVRNDYTLEVGDRLRTDVFGFAPTTANGILVAGNDFDPLGSGERRQNMLIADYWTGGGTARFIYLGNTAGTVVSIVTASVLATDITGFFILRDTLTTYSGGYYDLLGQPVILGTFNVSADLGGLATSPGSLGYYVDARAAGTYVADNFRLEVVIPEPASLALLAAGGLLAMRRQRRARR